MTTPLRHRRGKERAATQPPVDSDGADEHDEDRTTLSVLDVLRMALGVVLLSGLLGYFVTGDALWERAGTMRRLGKRSWRYMRGPERLTDDELAQFDGREAGRAIYVGLNGSVYDVSAGRGLYGPGGSYAFFAGRDATRAFVTGCFAEDLTWDLRGVEEMFMPLDDDAAAAAGDGVTGAEAKIRREREWREARRQ
ncbi:hypothetical protein GP486_008787, partial [Trichoglossum hirsutum]